MLPLSELSEEHHHAFKVRLDDVYGYPGTSTNYLELFMEPKGEKGEGSKGRGGEG